MLHKKYKVWNLFFLKCNLKSTYSTAATIKKFQPTPKIKNQRSQLNNKACIVCAIPFAISSATSGTTIPEYESPPTYIGLDRNSGNASNHCIQDYKLHWDSQNSMHFGTTIFFIVGHLDLLRNNTPGYFGTWSIGH